MDFEEYEKWARSLEGMLYNLKTIGDGSVWDDMDKVLIVKTLQKLPKDVKEKVLDNVVFVVLGLWGTVQNLRPTEVGRPLIMINFALMRNEGATDDDLMDTVAHEIAHYILGHADMSFSNLDGERQADDLSEKWGFKRVYNNYDLKI